MSLYSSLPLYWRDEQSGALARSVESFLKNQTAGGPLLETDIQLIRLYLQQWIDAPCWDQSNGDAGMASDLAALRREVRTLSTGDQIHDWLMRALDLGIDPL